MGVVYKLRQEVIEFILQQKRENPEVSCRKLVDIVQEKFQIPVSKSSVNAVLKGSGLSSPVGRRSKIQKKPQKYKIPGEKKEQLFAEEKPSIRTDVSPTQELSKEEPQVPLSSVEPMVESTPPEKKEESAEAVSQETQEKPLLKPKEEPPIPLPSPKEEEQPEGEKPLETPLSVSSEMKEESKSEISEAKEKPKEELKVTPQEEPPEKTAEVPPVVPESEKTEEKSIQEKPSEEQKKQPEEESEEFEEERPPLRLESWPQFFPGLPKEETKVEPSKDIPSTPAGEEKTPEVSSEKPLQEQQIEPEEESVSTSPPDIESKEAPILSSEEGKPAPKKDIEITPLADEDLSQIEREESSSEYSKQEASTPQEKVEEEIHPTAEESPEQATPKSVEADAESFTKEEASKKYVNDKIWIPAPEDFKTKYATKTSVPQKILDGMGCFFLKAAEWELSKSSILGGLLSRYTKTPLVIDINLASEVLLYLDAFAIKGLEELKSYNKDGLWELNGLKQKLSVETLTAIVDGLQNVKSIALAMSNEYSQIFSEISYIKVSLPEQIEFCIDAQLSSLWPIENVHSVFTTPLNKILLVLSANIVSNVQPVIILSAPGFKSFAKQFYEFLWSFENVEEKPKRIIKIGIFDGEKQEVAKFTAIPAKKRSFIIGVWPWQEECKKFIEEDIRQVTSFYSDILEKEVYYSQFKTTLPHPLIGQTIKVRVALLRHSGLGWPFMGLLTNISETEKSIEEIISAYLRKWPNPQESQEDFAAKSEKASYTTITVIPSSERVTLLQGDGQYNLLEGVPDVWTPIHFLLSALNNYCQRHFFPFHYEKLDFSAIRERVYSLSGYIEETKDVLKVHLVLASDYPYRRDLEYALARLNESDVRDYSGRRLLMGIVS